MTLRARVAASRAAWIDDERGGAQDIREELLRVLPPDDCRHGYALMLAHRLQLRGVVVCEDCREEVRVP